jgi:hypothetical protein
MEYRLFTIVRYNYKDYNINKMMGGWKQKSGWIQILPDSRVPFTLPFLSRLSVCLIVSRVRAHLTTDQHFYTLYLYLSLYL